MCVPRKPPYLSVIASRPPCFEAGSGSLEVEVSIDVLESQRGSS
jgi:hypothetical protein